jgi:hypothetical protein
VTLRPCNVNLKPSRVNLWPKYIKTRINPWSVYFVQSIIDSCFQRPRARSHRHLVRPCPSHASFIARSSCPHLRGNSSSLGTNVTIPGQHYKYSSYITFIIARVPSNAKGAWWLQWPGITTLVPTQVRAGRPNSEGGVGGMGPNRMKMWSSPVPFKATKLHLRGNSSLLGTNVTISGQNYKYSSYTTSIIPKLIVGVPSHAKGAWWLKWPGIATLVPTQVRARKPNSEGGVGGTGPIRMKMWSSPVPFKDTKLHLHAEIGTTILHTQWRSQKLQPRIFHRVYGCVLGQLDPSLTFYFRDPTCRKGSMITNPAMFTESFPKIALRAHPQNVGPLTL